MVVVQIWICGELCLSLCLLCLIFSIWVAWFAWLKALRVPQTVDLQCFFRRLVGSRWRSFLGWSTILTGASMVLLSFPIRLDLLRVLRCRGVCEKASSRSSQPRLAFSVAERPKSTRTEGWSRAVCAFWWSSGLCLSGAGLIACRAGPVKLGALFKKKKNLICIYCNLFFIL